MRFLISFLATLLLASLCWAADRAPMPPRYPTKPYCLCWQSGEECTCGVCACPGGYNRLYARAARDGKPLVVWVGVPGKAVPGCYCVSCPDLTGHGGACCVIGVSNGDGTGNVYQRAKLSCHATVDDVRRALSPPTQAVPPMQFNMTPYFAAPSFMSGGMRGGGC